MVTIAADTVVWLRFSGKVKLRYSHQKKGRDRCVRRWAC